MKRTLTLVLALVMLVSLLAGCAGDGEKTTTAATTAAATTAAATTAAATTTAAVTTAVPDTTAATTAADTTTAAPVAQGNWDTGSIAVDPLGIDLEGAEVSFICTIGLNDERTKVWEKGNQYLSETYNGTVSLNLCDSAEYAAKVKTQLASGMATDVIYTANSLGLPELVASEAFLPLDDYIPTYMPRMYAKVPAELYKAVTFNGKIYAMIPFKDLVENNSLLYDKTQTDAAGVDLQGWRRWSDNYDNFYKLREWIDSTDETRKDIPVAQMYEKWFREGVFEMIGNSNVGIGTNFAGVESVAGYAPFTDLFNVYDCPEFVAHIKTLNQLVIDRIYPYDRANFDKDNVYRNSGKIIVWASQGYLFAPDSIVDYDCVLAKQAISMGYTSYAAAMLNAVNADSENPVAACKLIEILDNDKYAGTILRFGEENVHWTLTDNGQADCTIGLDSKIKCWYGAQLGDITNCVLPTDVTPEFGDALTELNGNAIFSTNLGFTVDSTSVDAECAAISAVTAEYLSNTTLYSGMLTDAETEAMAAEFVDKMNANGIQDVLTEYQQQLDDWYAAQG